MRLWHLHCSSILLTFEKSLSELPLLFGRQDSQVGTLAANKDAVRKRAEAGHQMCRLHPSPTFFARSERKRLSRLDLRLSNSVHCNSPLDQAGAQNFSVTNGCRWRHGHAAAYVNYVRKAIQFGGRRAFGTGGNVGASTTIFGAASVPVTAQGVLLRP
jgi:hypothetical protein